MVGPKANQEEWQLRNQFTAKTGIVFNKEWQTYESSIHFNWLAKHQLHGHNLDVKDIGFSTDLGLQGHWIVQAGINLLTPLKQKTPRVISARSIAPNEALRIPGFSSNPAFSARLSGPSKGDHSVAHLKGLPTLPPLSSVTNLFKKKSAHSYLDTRKSLIKTGYSLEPSGGLTGVIGPPEGGLALRLENYNCQTPQCKEIANETFKWSASLRICGTRPEVLMVTRLREILNPLGSVSILVALTVSEKFAKGSPMPMKTTLVIKSSRLNSFCRSCFASNTWPMISADDKLRLNP